ncbi:hypothetical protein PGT21_003540 [Puccinia graminis f. sp. tritici]|uniref:Uncharacterized protein n=1 Tax=Puccinia graminis f. sp. tritici TaxID=56615 RepID=A0A5B0QVY6_PUCGR|nr:hypothetical protein PGT21_003540 [Puccinia graminis f. sp. tritici]
MRIDTAALLGLIIETTAFFKAQVSNDVSSTAQSLNGAHAGSQYSIRFTFELPHVFAFSPLPLPGSISLASVFNSYGVLQGQNSSDFSRRFDPYLLRGKMY